MCRIQFLPFNLFVNNGEEIFNSSKKAMVILADGLLYINSKVYGHIQNVKQINKNTKTPNQKSQIDVPIYKGLCRIDHK